MKTITVESDKELLEVEFTLTWQDHAAAEHALRRKLRTEQGRSYHFAMPLLGAVLMAALGGTMLWRQVVAETLGVAGLTLLLLAPMVLAGGSWFVRRKDRQRYGQFRNESCRKQRCIASADGLQFEWDGVHTSFPWSAVRQIYRLGGGSLALFVNSLNYFLIPERAFVTENQQARFLRLTRAHAGAANDSKSGQPVG